MAFGLSAGAVGAIGAIGGALISSNAAGDASDSQAAATAASNAELREQRRQTREDLTPWRVGGQAANNKLMRLLGINAPAEGSYSRDQLRSQLAGKYTTGATQDQWIRGAAGGAGDNAGDRDELIPGTAGGVDENALQAAIERAYAAQPQADNSGEDFGSLLRNFTGKDLASEPGYQFGREQGEQGIDRAAASRGSFLSGAALKALGRFNSDYAGTKFGEAFNRDSTNKNRTYGFLTGASQQGQSAAAQTGANGLQIAQGIGQNTTALGNAQGASSIAQGNAFSGALNNINQTNQQNAFLRAIQGGNAGWGTTGNSSTMGFGGVY